MGGEGAREEGMRGRKEERGYDSDRWFHSWE